MFCPMLLAASLYMYLHPIRLGLVGLYTGIKSWSKFAPLPQFGSIKVKKDRNRDQESCYTTQ
jgi:hypothetical protein